MNSNDIAERLGTEVRPILDLIDNFRKLGLQNDVPIPQIAVMGDQSAESRASLKRFPVFRFLAGLGWLRVARLRSL